MGGGPTLLKWKARSLHARGGALTESAKSIGLGYGTLQVVLE